MPASAALGAGGYASIGLGALEVWSGFQQAEIVRQNAGLQAQIQEFNAQFADVDAYEAEKFGYTKSARYQTSIDATLGEQKAAYAAQNVDVNYGTAKVVQEQSKLTGYLNKLDILREARERAMGFKREASNLRLGAHTTRMQGDLDASAAQTGAIFQGAATGLSGYARR